MTATPSPSPLAGFDYVVRVFGTNVTITSLMSPATAFAFRASIADGLGVPVGGVFIEQATDLSTGEVRFFTSFDLINAPMTPTMGPSAPRAPSPFAPVSSAPSAPPGAAASQRRLQANGGVVSAPDATAGLLIRARVNLPAGSSAETVAALRTKLGGMEPSILLSSFLTNVGASTVSSSTGGVAAAAAASPTPVASSSTVLTPSYIAIAVAVLIAGALIAASIVYVSRRRALASVIGAASNSRSRSSSQSEAPIVCAEDVPVRDTETGDVVIARRDLLCDDESPRRAAQADASPGAASPRIQDRAAFLPSQTRNATAQLQIRRPQALGAPDGTRVSRVHPDAVAAALRVGRHSVAGVAPGSLRTMVSVPWQYILSGGQLAPANNRSNVATTFNPPADVDVVQAAIAVTAPQTDEVDERGDAEKRARLHAGLQDGQAGLSIPLRSPTPEHAPMLEWREVSTSFVEPAAAATPTVLAESTLQDAAHIPTVVAQSQPATPVRVATPGSARRSVVVASSPRARIRLEPIATPAQTPPSPGTLGTSHTPMRTHTHLVAEPLDAYVLSVANMVTSEAQVPVATSPRRLPSDDEAPVKPASPVLSHSTVQSPAPQDPVRLAPRIQMSALPSLDDLYPSARVCADVAVVVATQREADDRQQNDAQLPAQVVVDQSTASRTARLLATLEDEEDAATAVTHAPPLGARTTSSYSSREPETESGTSIHSHDDMSASEEAQVTTQLRIQTYSTPQPPAGESPSRTSPRGRTESSDGPAFMSPTTASMSRMQSRAAFGKGAPSARITEAATALTQPQPATTIIASPAARVAAAMSEVTRPVSPRERVSALIHTYGRPTAVVAPPATARMRANPKSFRETSLAVVEPEPELPTLLSPVRPPMIQSPAASSSTVFHHPQSWADRTRNVSSSKAVNSDDIRVRNVLLSDAEVTETGEDEPVHAALDVSEATPVTMPGELNGDDSSDGAGDDDHVDAFAPALASALRARLADARSSSRKPAGASSESKIARLVRAATMAHASMRKDVSAMAPVPVGPPGRFSAQRALERAQSHAGMTAHAPVPTASVAAAPVAAPVVSPVRLDAPLRALARGGSMRAAARAVMAQVSHADAAAPVGDARAPTRDGRSSSPRTASRPRV